MTDPESNSSGGGDDTGIKVIEMSNMRRMIADHMVESKKISPHTYTVAEVDMTSIVKYREKTKQKFLAEKGFKLTYTPFILHATVLALKAHPLVNSSVVDGKIYQKQHINLGVAVALESGLIVPVIKNAEEKNLLGLARKANELGLKAQNKKLTPTDVQDGTFTVTNPGIWGNIFGLPIINQPQLGILGVGAIKKRPVVVDDAIAIRSIMYLSLSYDHRVIDGALAARFLQEIRSILEDYDMERAF
jgi:pyruvate/2-oxoglutarate dehydrogenase complex dihydrolipoamide acyltransferase (E2) component